MRCGALHVEAADLRVLARLGERRRLARRGGAPRRRPRRCRPGRRRAAGSGSAAPSSRSASAAASSSSAARSSSFTCCSSASCSGDGLPFSFVLPAQLVDPRHQRAPALVGLERCVEGFGGTLPCQRGPVGVRVVAGGLEVDHARESRSRYASIACATPCSSGPGQSQSAFAFSSSLPFSTQTP